MPLRLPHDSPVRQDGTVDSAALRDHFERLRGGQYESDWTKIAASASATLKHELNEIPWSVDVIRSSSADGSSPVNGNASVTVTKSAETVVVTNTATDTYYFQVRAF